jgi:mycofactocin precursor
MADTSTAEPTEDTTVTTTTTTTAAAADLADDVLVEEVCIDGMCGVY